MNHTKLLNEQRDLWVQRGYETRIEGQNAFRRRGRSATLAGKPDLLVLNKDHVLITDVKTDQERPSHRYQLMTYLYALPRALHEFRGARIAGEIIYPNRTQRVPQGGVRTAECRFYDIAAADCQERVEKPQSTLMTKPPPTTGDQQPCSNEVVGPPQHLQALWDRPYEGWLPPRL